jgi:catechol 2,3-dioxygenase-like lactoylglutathione lyase family enzyme
VTGFKSLLSHIEFNVRDYKRSVLFYDLILPPLGWKKLNSTQQFTAYTDGALKIILSPTEPEFEQAGFHRKRIGLNHLALVASSKKAVDDFLRDIILPNQIRLLYSEKPDDDDDYYALYFEDPDRIKIEVVYAPNYCSPSHWPNNLENDFDPNS